MGVATWGTGSLIALFAASCGFQQPTDLIVATSGTGQVGIVATEISEPFVATVEEASGEPIPGFAVTFVVTAGDGRVSTTTTTTDDQGSARTRFTLGTVAGANMVEVAAADVTNRPSFSATGTAAAATQLLPDSSTTLTYDEPPNSQGLILGVTAEDTYNNPVPGLAVTFTNADGEVSPTTASSNDEGIAQTVFHPTAPGSSYVDVQAPGLPQVEFTIFYNSGVE
jgi:hypothetical protein